MGNNSIKSNKKKKKIFCCCLCSSSTSIDDKNLPTFDRILLNNDLSNQSIEIFEKYFQLTSFEYLINKYQLKYYLIDYLNRLKVSKNNQQTFKKHFLSSTIIYPYNTTNQVLIDDLNLVFIIPSESILPYLLVNTNSLYKIHEQIRSICYFIPLNNYHIEPDDEQYKQKLNSIENKSDVELESICRFISNDGFQTGLICIDQDEISKEFLSFRYFSSEDNLVYLSANLIQKWFNTLILVNQTCVIAKRFLMGDKNHINCLFKKQQNTNHENLFSYDNNLIFATLRLPPCPYITELPSINNHEEKSEQILDGFFPLFLSDNKYLASDYIHIDYEQYSFAFILSRWPNILIDNYYTNPTRFKTRLWPTKSQMNLIIKKSLLLIPISNTHQWKINFDLIEKHLFELMNEPTLCFYILCQQFYSQTYANRFLIKHSFLNYCEKYGLSTINDQNNLNRFLNYLSEQINKRFLPNYFNHKINLLNSNENYHQWLEYINKYRNISSSSSSSLIFSHISNRPIIIKYLFNFLDQLYQTYHKNHLEFDLNEKILLDLHIKLSNNNDLIDNTDILNNIQKNLTYDYEVNAELVHSCLNQIRKSDSSLIFHYTWTIFIQYLHTYFNVLWNS